MDIGLQVEAEKQEPNRVKYYSAAPARLFLTNLIQRDESVYFSY